MQQEKNNDCTPSPNPIVRTLWNYTTGDDVAQQTPHNRAQRCGAAQRIARNSYDCPTFTRCAQA
jgi:hypothetical protein